MKTVKKSILLVLMLLFSISSFAQKISLGDDVGYVSNVLRALTRSYNTTQGYSSMESGMKVKYYDGVISEIDVWVRNGYLYDLRLSADYMTRYLIFNGKLDYISIEYANISVKQLTNSFNIQYNERHIGEYYFSEDYSTYKMVYLSKKGLAIVDEVSTAKTHFSTKVAEALQRRGIVNKFMDTKASKQIKPSTQQRYFNGSGGGSLTEGKLIMPFDTVNLEQNYRRSFIISPLTPANNNSTGKIVIAIKFNRSGDVVEAQTDQKYTTIRDTTLWRSCEGAALKGKLNAREIAPELQKGLCFFYFRQK